MPKNVTQDDINRWIKLRKKRYTFRKIGEKTGWNEDTIRKHLVDSFKSSKEEIIEQTKKKSIITEFRSQSILIGLVGDLNIMKSLVETKSSNRYDTFAKRM